MFRLVDPSAPYPQQTLLTPVGPGAPARQTGPTGPAFIVDSAPFADQPTHLSSPSGLAPGAGTAAPAAFDPRTGPVPELPGSIRPGLALPSPRRSRRRLALAAGSAAAVVVLAVAGVLLLNRGPASNTPNGTPSSSRPASAASTPPATSPPASTPPASSPQATVRAAGPTIPAAFAGTWNGTATLAAIGAPGVEFKNPITFTMTAGGTTAQENEAGGCVNTLTLTSTTAGVLTFSEPGTGGCVAGTVTFTRRGATLAYRWTDNVEQETATLRES